MTKYDPDIHNRRSIRLKGYDYSKAGLYFVTICTQNHLCLFGNIDNGKMVLNDAGIMVGCQWQLLTSRFDKIKLHNFVVMPNHFHGIIEFVGVPLVGTQNTVGDVLGVLKSLSTNEYIRGVNKNWKPFDKKLWQRNYFEHIIRSEKSYYQITEYIKTNPMKWQEDKYFV